MFTQGDDGRRYIAGPRMLQEELDLLAHNFFGRLRLALTLPQIGIDHIPQIVDVIQKNVADLVNLRVNITGNRNVDNKHRTVLAQVNHAFSVRLVQNERGRTGRADDDVSTLDVSKQILRLDGFAFEHRSKFKSALVGPIPDEHLRNPGACQVLGGQFAHLAGTEYQDGFPFQIIENLLG